MIDFLKDPDPVKEGEKAGEEAAEAAVKKVRSRPKAKPKAAGKREYVNNSGSILWTDAGKLYPGDKAMLTPEQAAGHPRRLVPVE